MKWWALRRREGGGKRSNRSSNRAPCTNVRRRGPMMHRGGAVALGHGVVTLPLGALPAGNGCGWDCCLLLCCVKEKEECSTPALRLSSSK